MDNCVCHDKTNAVARMNGNLTGPLAATLVEQMRQLASWWQREGLESDGDGNFKDIDTCSHGITFRPRIERWQYIDCTIEAIPTGILVSGQHPH